MTCPHCSSPNTVSFGYQQQRFADIPRNGKPRILRLKRPRYRCKECHRTFQQPRTDLDTKRHMTVELLAIVKQELSQGKPALEIAAAVGLNERTIRNIAIDAGIQLKRGRPSAS